MNNYSSKKRISIVLFFLVIILSSSSCSFRKVLRKGSTDEKHEAGLQYYAEEDYFRAGSLFEDILPIIRGQERAEIVNLYYAYCQFYQSQYILSESYFKSFMTVYGRSDHLIEATYMHAYSLYMQSPESSLDQTSTILAVNALQSFLNRYPNSDYAKQTDALINELQVKLEQKAYDNAKLYYNITGIKGFRPALIVFENFEKDFPDSKFNQEIAFLDIEVRFNYARRSTRRKQKERFQDTVNSYEKFINKYPKSEYLRQGGDYYEKSLKELAKFEN